VVGRAVMPHSRCTEIFKLARNWIDDCFISHLSADGLSKTKNLLYLNGWLMCLYRIKTLSKSFKRAREFRKMGCFKSPVGCWASIQPHDKESSATSDSSFCLLTATHFPGCYNNYEATWSQIPLDRFFMHPSGLG